MKYKIFNHFIKLLSKVTKRRIVYFQQINLFGKTAVKSSLGFWYVGDVLDSSDIAYGILRNGVVEPEGTKLVNSILRRLLSMEKEIVFYDIGSNTGYFGVMAAFIGQGKIKTYAFEPVFEFVTAEEETLRLNRLEKLVKIFNLALGDESKNTEVYLGGSGTTLFKNFLGKEEAQARQVRQERLDDVVAKNNLALPHFVKIDVEGAEFLVLRGGQQLIAKALPVIWYESVLTLKVRKFNNPHFYQTQTLLKNMGYRIFRCALNKFINIEEDMVPDGVWMYLALHPQKHANILKDIA